MSKFTNCTAVITGAGSGIGRELALQLGQQGAKLAISDINQQNIEQTADMLKAKGVDVHSTVLDVANQDAVFDYATQVEAHFGEVNLVINNAGVALSGGPLWETPLEDFKWLMDINFYGVVYGTKAFLPMLMRAKWGHVVNISSIFGIIGVPEQNAYNSSKFAVRGLTEALRQELELANSNVSCTSVHPGGIKTNIVAAARVSAGNKMEDEAARKQATDHFAKIAGTTAESAASQIVRAVEKNKRRLLIGRDAKLIDLVQRLFPTGYHKVMWRLLGFMSEK